MGEKDSFRSGTIYEIRKPNFNKKGNNKARTINKRLPPPPNIIEKLLTNADWISVSNVPWGRLDERFKGSRFRVKG